MKGDILIVDDELENLTVLENLLEKEGYKVRAAINGQLALRASITRPPEIILLDVVMGGLDGYEVCRQLKANPVTAHIPVLFLSAHSDISEKLRAFEMGGQDYISKPFAAAEVLARVKVHLEHSRLEIQLKRANDELESFVRSISHDLRAPLRWLSGYLHIFKEDYNAELSEAALKSLEHIASITRQMQAMVEDLLQLSRISRAELHLQPVELGAMAQEILREFQTTESARQVDFTVAPTSTVQGDPGLLRIALTNLLSNAWKFTGRREKATIEFGVMDGDTPIYFVRDNGVGFDPENVNRLFGVFQRLHPDSDFPGVGVGLATVRRIIQHHGGQIWAEGAPEQGATFYFTLGGTVF